MKLEILSFDEALKFIPKDKTYGIRIYDSIPNTPIPELVQSDNWIAIKEYFFNDGWPRSWKEYSWVDKNDEYFSGLLEEPWNKFHERNPGLTKESFLDYLESQGHYSERGDLFNEKFARQILSDYENFWEGAETILIHCNRGKNRSPAVGKAMNELYGWKINDLEKRFPLYRRYIYNSMIKAGEEFRKQ